MGWNGPPASSVPGPDGKIPQFTLLEDRCDACEVYGGEQPPCVQRSLLPKILEQTTAEGRPRPCPRIFLDDGNAVAWELFPLVVGESAQFPVMFSLVAAAYGLDEHESLMILRRINYAAGHPLFVEAKKDAERDMARQREQEAKR